MNDVYLLLTEDGRLGHNGDLLWVQTLGMILSARVLVEVSVSHVSLRNEVNVNEVIPGQVLGDWH